LFTISADEKQLVILQNMKEKGFIMEGGDRKR
jgi:hypothetical protein